MKKTRLAALPFFVFAFLSSRICFAAEGLIPVSVARNCSAGAGAITQPGSYFLSNDIDNVDPASGCAAGHAIVIQTNHVTLDLRGHTITVSTGNYAGVYSEGYSDIEIRNGKITSVTASNLAGVDLSGAGAEYQVQGLTITGFQGAGIAVKAGACTGALCRAVIEANTIKPSNVSPMSGIYLECAEASRVERNQVRGCDDGIFLADTNSSIVRNNIASANAGVGIYLYESNGNTIIDNVAAYNNGTGVEVMETSHYNAIDRNQVSGNGGCGIYFSDVTGSEAYENVYDGNRAMGPGGAYCGNTAGNTPGADNLP